MTDKIVLCKDCKYFIKDQKEKNIQLVKCLGPSEINFVTGEESPVYCSIKNWDGDCSGFEEDRDQPEDIEELLFAELYISELSFKYLMPGDEVVDKHGNTIASYPEPWWKFW